MVRLRPHPFSALMVRLLLVALAACLSLPAAATPACHMPPAAPMAQSHHVPRGPESTAPAHLCIGCVPIGDWLRALQAPLLPPALPPEPHRTRLDPGRGFPPALPPPRIA